MNQLIRQLPKLKDHAIVLIGSNLIGLMNLILGLAVLHLGDANTFNEYSAYASFYFILSAPSKITKNLGSIYGSEFLSFLKNSLPKKNKSLFWILSLILILLISGLIFFSINDGNYLTPIIVVLAGISQMVGLTQVGVIQNQQDFWTSTKFLSIQNLVRLILGIGLFILLKNFGVWLATLLGSLIVFILSYKYLEKHSLINKNIPLSLKDIIINILLLVLVEVLFSIDSIFVLDRLAPNEAETYNSFVILRKAIYFSIFGLSTILVSQGRKKSKKHGIFLNLGLAGLMGAVISFLLLVFENIVFSIFSISPGNSEVYLLFVISSVLFSIFLLTNLWFTSLKNYKLRYLNIVLNLIFIFVYVWNITSLTNTLWTLIIGILVLLGVHFGVIVFSKQS